MNQALIVENSQNKQKRKSCKRREGREKLVDGWKKHEFCAWHRLVIIRYKETGSREGPSILPAEGKRECEDNEKS